MFLRTQVYSLFLGVCLPEFLRKHDWQHLLEIGFCRSGGPFSLEVARSRVDSEELPSVFLE